MKPGLASRNRVDASDAADLLHNRGFRPQIPVTLAEAREHEGVFVIRRSRRSLDLLCGVLEIIRGSRYQADCWPSSPGAGAEPFDFRWEAMVAPVGP